jgi:hypothetical protein
VVAVTVQSAFCLEMHQNNIFFYFLKIIFDISISKRYENIKKKIIVYKKILILRERRVPKYALKSLYEIMVAVAV